jgi:enoyl-CoA hydratase/carnithine racemase
MLTFDLKGESVNKLSSAVVAELDDAVKAIQGESGLKGLVIGSAKDAFIVGADITEFHGLFDKGEEYLVEMLEVSTASSTPSRTCRSPRSPPSTAWRWAAAARCC